MAAVFINVTAFINVAARPGFLYGSSRTAQPARRGDHSNHGNQGKPKSPRNDRIISESFQNNMHYAIGMCA